MSYSRESPSPRYRQLVEMYRDMHLHGERHLGIPAKQTFDGRSLHRQLGRIKNLIRATRALSVLDYGCGKGTQYDPRPVVVAGEGRWEGVIDYWGVDEVTCFDPAYPPLSKRPVGSFDGVVCTDVLEHCPEEDMPWIVADLFSYATKFVYATVACHPARKRLPDGQNAHCTIREPQWWAQLFGEVAARHPQITWEVWLQYRTAADAPEKGFSEMRLGNSAPQQPKDASQTVC
jgi:hypothetical protein